MMKKLRDGLLCVAALAAILCSGGSARAALAYSFEPDLEGFGANPLGPVLVTQDTIGTTDGSNSMKIDMSSGVTYGGALTGNLTPPIGNPPGIQSLLFDMTIAQGQEFTGAYADIFVVMFAADQVPTYGYQVQFADHETFLLKPAGTYPVEIDLTSATHPITNATNQSFDEIFGTSGSGPNDMIPTGLQLTIAKSGDAPLTVYIDNIRTVVPEPTTGLLLGLGAVCAGFAGRRRR